VIAGVAVLVGIAGLTYVLAGAASPPAGPAALVAFTPDGKLKKPEGYRKWVHVGAPITPNELNGGEAPFRRAKRPSRRSSIPIKTPCEKKCSAAKPRFPLGRRCRRRRFARRRKGTRGTLVIEQGEPNLLEIVGALRTTGRLAGRLHCRQQKRDQNGDDGDDHQKFDQGERLMMTLRARPRPHRFISPEPKLENQ
jgi:hypothetical protein